MELELKTYLSDNLKELGLSVEEIHIELIELLYDEMIAYNAHTNLTRITDAREFIDKHILDSLSSIKAFDKDSFDKELKIIDIGTGAGFPALPLWFFFKNWNFMLIDSSRKKINFIEEFLQKAEEKFEFLNLDNIHVMSIRAEDLAREKEHREKYDIVINRAVSKLVSVIELSMPFLKVNGNFIAMKSFEVEDEILESKKVLIETGGKLSENIKFELLNTGLKRSFVIIKKFKVSSSNYPRRTGLAQNNPII